jgi:branched-subunit amino acid transport protein
VTTWMVIMAVGLGSYALRALPVVLEAGWLRSPRVERTMGYAGTAALAALIVVGLRRSASTPVDTAAVIVAAATAVIVAVRRGSMPKILLAGGCAYAAALASASLLA